MVKKQQIESNQTPSALSQFKLDFEYDRLLRDIKRDVRIRTI